MANNQKWSEKQIITSIDNTTEFCVLHGNNPIDNRRINAATLLATKAPINNPNGGQNNYAPLTNPTFYGAVTSRGLTVFDNTGNDDDLLVVNGVEKTADFYGTIASTDNSTKLATTAFVQAQKDSPTFTGTVKTPALAIGPIGSETTITTSATELNYVDGVSSNIQNQLNSRVRYTQIMSYGTGIPTGGNDGDSYLRGSLAVGGTFYRKLSGVWNTATTDGLFIYKDIDLGQDSYFLKGFGDDASLERLVVSNSPTFTGNVTLGQNIISENGNGYIDLPYGTTVYGHDPILNVNDEVLLPKGYVNATTFNVGALINAVDDVAYAAASGGSIMGDLYRNGSILMVSQLNQV